MDPRYTLAGVAVMLAVFAVSGVPWWLVLVVVAVVGAGVFLVSMMRATAAREEGAARPGTNGGKKNVDE